MPASGTLPSSSRPHHKQGEARRRNERREDERERERGGGRRWASRSPPTEHYTDVRSWHRAPRSVNCILRRSHGGVSNCESGDDGVLSLLLSLSVSLSLSFSAGPRRARSSDAEALRLCDAVSFLYVASSGGYNLRQIQPLRYTCKSGVTCVRNVGDTHSPGDERGSPVGERADFPAKDLIAHIPIHVADESRTHKREVREHHLAN